MACEGTVRRIVALAVRRIVAHEARDVLVATELRWIIHADALHGDRQFTHLLANQGDGSLTHFWLMLQMLFIPFINKLNTRAKIQNLYYNCK